MPNNSVTKTFTLDANSKGVVQLTQQIDKLAGSIDKLATNQQKVKKSTKETNNATDAWAKQAKGVAGIAANNTKVFAKMAQGMTGNLVPAYATLAANIFAVSAAFRVMKDAADFQRLQEASLEYSKAIGINLGKVAKDMRAITDDSITMQESMRLASMAAAAGFAPKTINDLAKAARNASVALGRDMTDSLNRVFSGALKAEPELLDELGIILRLKPATDKYAAALGKTASQLSTFEKQTAVVNEVISQADAKFGHLGETMASGNAYAQLYAKIANGIKIALGGLNTILTPVISALVQLDGVLMGLAVAAIPNVLKLFGEQAHNVFTSFEK